MKRKTQHDVVIEHLRKYKTITSWDAIMEYGVTRLSHHIYCYNIPTERITVKTRLGNTTSIAKYSLIEKPIQASLF